MPSSALMASGSRSIAASEPLVPVDAAEAADTDVPAAVAASGWTGVAPVVPTVELAASVLTGCFDSTDCRLQDTNVSGSTRAVAQVILRNRSEYIDDLRPGQCSEAAL